jgi:MinD superfamily P-loop ATPase
MLDTPWGYLIGAKGRQGQVQLAQSQANIKIDEQPCQACKKCFARRVCKGKAIVQMDPTEFPSIDLTRCFDCRLCIAVCPFGAISAQQASGPI